ncbi:MAG: alpha/beta hydrolase, partial [Pseudomonadales bacterium]
MPAQASRVEANGIELAYETFGSTADEVVLLISGLGTQMTRWTAEFCELLARHGHRVIRFDNRDTGLSTHFTQRGVPDFAALAADVQSGRTPDVAYTLQDMAADAIG